MTESLHDKLERDGFAIVRGVISPGAAGRLREEAGPALAAGRRGALAMAGAGETARSAALMGLVQPCLSGPARPVRGIYFDKTPELNWLVPWHQDLTLAVAGRVEAEGYGPWSVKDSIPHVQPPVALLERMVTARLHLDAADEENGALRVLPGSHRHGKLSPDGIAAWRGQTAEVVCQAAAGDVLLMRPLLLHASGRSASTRQRRVLHIEYAGFSLAPGLDWHEAA